MWLFESASWVFDIYMSLLSFNLLTFHSRHSCFTGFTRTGVRCILSARCQTLTSDNRFRKRQATCPSINKFFNFDLPRQCEPKPPRCKNFHYPFFLNRLYPSAYTHVLICTLRLLLIAAFFPPVHTGFANLYPKNDLPISLNCNCKYDL